MYNLLSNWHSSGLRSSTICGKRVQSCIYVKTALNGRRFASVFIFSEKKKRKQTKITSLIEIKKRSIAF